MRSHSHYHFETHHRVRPADRYLIRFILYGLLVAAAFVLFGAAMALYYFF